MVHFKSLEMWAPRYWKLWTISTIAPLMNRGKGVWLLLLKSMTSSFVFPTFILAAPVHHIVYLLPVRRLIVVGYQSHYCCVVCEFHNMTAWMFG